MTPQRGPREERFTRPELEGVRLRVLHWGGGPKTPLALLHGAGANAHWWDHLAEALAADRPVAALDFRGHGDSDFPETVRPGALADDLDALLAHLGWADAVLVGHSLGAHVALDRAAREPARTRGLALLDPARGATPSRRRATRLALHLRRSYASFEEAVARFRFLPGAAGAEEALRRGIAERSVRLEPDGRYGYKFDPRWMSVATRAAPDPAAVRCPVLVLRGETSPLLTREGAEQWRAELGGARVVEVPEAGHHVHLDRPERALELLAEFLAELEDELRPPRAAP